jgi:hypothetical protein
MLGLLTWRRRSGHGGVLPLPLSAQKEAGRLELQLRRKRCGNLGFPQILKISIVFIRQLVPSLFF